MSRNESAGELALEKLAESLRAAFGEAVSAQMAEGSLRLQVGPKAAWINATGRLVGESFDGPGSLEVGVDEGGVVVASARSPIVS